MRSSPLKRSCMDHTVVTLQTHYTCLYHVSVHQMAPPLSSDNSHLIGAYYSSIDPRRMKGWVGLVSWHTADGYKNKWLPINCYCYVGAGQGKFAGQKPTFFYHWATPLPPPPPPPPLLLLRNYNYYFWNYPESLHEAIMWFADVDKRKRVTTVI